MTEVATTQTASLAMLRDPFPPSEIRYLPRVWCKACRDSKAGCSHHNVGRCDKCRQSRISSAHIDLAFVGHAEATNRLLKVDPMWSWEPLAVDARGLPQYDENGGLWIRLTVCGVTRLGYGNAEGKRGGDAIKEIIGDAIRNAGMRFGMALDLWTSSELEQADNLTQPHSRQQDDDPWSAPPRRNYIVEAQQCTTADCAVEVYRQAEVAGVSVDVLDAIRSIGQRLRAAEQATIDDDVVDVEAVETVGEESQDPDDLGDGTHAAAVASLRDWAAVNGVDDIDGDAYKALGVPLAFAAPDAIRGLLAQLSTTP